MQSEKLYSQAEVNRIFSHVPRSTLRTWILQELHSWAMERNDERGRGRYYKRDNIYQLGIVENLSKLDIATDLIRKIIADVGDPPSMNKFIFITKSSEISPSVFRNLDEELSKLDNNWDKKLILYLEGLGSRRWNERNSHEKEHYDLLKLLMKHRRWTENRSNREGYDKEENEPWWEEFRRIYERQRLDENNNSKHHKAFFDWSYAIVSPKKMYLLMLLPLSALIPITIAIDLRAIKKFIDMNFE